MNEKNTSASDLENSTVNEVKDVLMNATQEIKNKFSAIEKNITHYAKKNPVKLMGISLIAGVLIGQLFRSRR
jgi:ElaB/YqjD/DUF883 family membrane-anchored ribosome-binding protein